MISVPSLRFYTTGDPYLAVLLAIPGAILGTNVSWTDFRSDSNPLTACHAKPCLGDSVICA